MQARQQQYIQMILNNRQLFRIDKKFNHLDLNKFDVELSENFRQKFPGSVQFKKNSSSPTAVLKTKVGGKEYFVKVFNLPLPKKEATPPLDIESPIMSLLYEKEVYRYLRSVAVKNKEIKKHFIQMLLSARDQKTNMGFIFTEDSGGVPLYKIQSSEEPPLSKYFNDVKHTITAQFVSNIFTQLLYVIYLLNSINVVHNDLHFGNVLLVKDNIENKEYEIYGYKFMVKDHPYSLKVYDFDMASIVDPSEWRNTFRAGLCHDYGRCKDYIYTDNYVWLVHLLEPNTWQFADKIEKQKYILVVDYFKKVFKSKAIASKGFFQKLFGAVATTSPIDIIQSKHIAKQNDPPIFHASCQVFMERQKCIHPSKPVQGAELASAWSSAISILKK